MPNWVSNSISISGKEKDLKQIVKYVKSKTSDFDFNKIIPMPKSLAETEASSNNYWDLYEYCKKNNLPIPPICLDRIWHKANKQPDLEKGEQLYNNIKNYGYLNWYDWSVDNWGTKWNVLSEDIEITLKDKEVLEISFQTAWSPPFPIFEEITKKFSIVTLVAKCISEGIDVEYEFTYYGGEMINSLEFPFEYDEEKDEFVNTGVCNSCKVFQYDRNHHKVEL